MRPVSVPKAGLSVPNRCNIIAFGREVLSVKAHKGKALDGLKYNENFFRLCVP